MTESAWSVVVLCTAEQRDSLVGELALRGLQSIVLPGPAASLLEVESVASARLESDSRRTGSNADSASAAPLAVPNYAELVEKLNEAQRSARIGSWDWDIATGAVWWSDETYRIFGVSRESYVPTVESNASFVHPEDRAAFHQAAFLALEMGQPFSFDLRICAADGSVKVCDFRGAVHRGEDGKAFRFSGTIADITDRMRSEVALHESSARFQRLFGLPLIGICLSAPTKGLLEVNDRLCQMLGYSRAELQPLTWADLTHPEDLEKDLAQFESVIRGEIDGYTLEKRFVRKDGMTLPADLSVGCVRKADGSVDYFVVLVQDISDRKRAEEDLRKSEDEFRYLFENSVVGKTITSLTGEIRVNKAFARMLGYEKAELARARWADLTHPEDLEKSQGFLDRVLSGDEPSARFVKRYFRKDGSVLWGEVSTAIRRDASGRPLYFMTNVLDVSERKKAEDVLRASEEKYRRIIETTHDGVWMIDGESRTTFVNRRMAEMLGSSPEEMLGQPLFSFMTDDARAAAERYLERRKKGIAEQHDFCFQRKDGSEVWAILGTTPILAPDGAYTGALATVTDITERKTVEAALRESTERNGTILKTAMDGFWLADPQGLLLEVNEAYCRMSGYSESELLSMRISDLEAAENPDDTSAHMRKIQSQGSDRFESRHRRKDGTIFDVEVSVQQSPIEGGLMVAFLRDISERKLLEQERRSLQEDLTATVEALPDLMFDVDRENRIFDFRAPEPGLLFAKPEEFLGKLVQEALPPRAAQVVSDAIAEAVRNGSHIGSGFPLPMPDGERWFELSIAAKGGPDGGRERFVVLSRDITERKRGEERLRENERRYRIVAENTSAWEFWVDQQGRYTYCSPSCEELTGHGPEEFIADPGLLRTLVHPDDRDALVEHKRMRLEKGASGLRHDRDAIVFRVVRPDGTVCWVEHVCSTVVDEEGRFLGVRGSNRDITSRRKAEDEFRRLNAELEGRVLARTEELAAANKELESFSYSVSHDLRAPLRAIEGFSGLLVKESSGHLTAEDIRLLGVVRSNAIRMSVLISDLLTFSRCGRSEIRRDRLKMRSKALSVFGDLAGDRDLRSRIDFRVGDLPDAVGDASLIRQVWINLLSNALKYSARQARPLIEVSGAVDGEFAVYHVRDNGVGFDMKYVDKLFGVFQRLHGPREFEGTGIGLALVKRIVERHGGRVWAEGEVGKGATIHFTLGPAPSVVETTGASA